MKYFILLLIFSTQSFANFNFFKKRVTPKLNTFELLKTFNNSLFKSNSIPESLIYDGEKYNFTNQINDKLTSYIHRTIKSYRPDYVSVVVIDNNTGRIIVVTDYSRKTKQFGKRLSFSATNPAASVFKVITAADLLENTQIEKDSLFSYNGKGSTLYKYQLKDKKTKWTRHRTLKKAFALSNNVIFGKAAQRNLSQKSLNKMAFKFGFNRELLDEVDMSSSVLYQVSDKYDLAELASGFNRDTMISPFHGAVMASVVGNGGFYKRPSLLSEVTEDKSGETVWTPDYHMERVLNKESAAQLKELMNYTVQRGTASSAFRKLKRKWRNTLEIGGKTGTITGGIPYGKRDWFVSYAKPKNSKDAGISVSVMIVNEEKWYVKSAYLAKQFIQYYYDNKAKMEKLNERIVKR